MSPFSKDDKLDVWSPDTVEPPWRGDTSIYAHILAHIPAEGGGLTDGGHRLPDEVDDGGIKWVAGGLDGAFGHHGAGGSENTRAKLIYRALEVVLQDATPIKLQKLYELLLQGSVIDFIDPLLERILTRQDVDPNRLEELAVWLARRSPDRDPVKLAIALLGLVNGSDHSELLMTLGRHEEFTLYAAVALSNSADDWEDKMFTLAQQVEGWGRIQLVERLSETTDPDVKAWMLRTGYKNDVMYEYLAYTCATAGELREALEQGSVDDALLAGAGDLIGALIAGGPAQDMDDYDDGAAVVARYVHHLGAEPRCIAQLIAVGDIRRFLDADVDWSAREQRGWTPQLRAELRASVTAIEAAPYWHDIVRDDLSSSDALVFSRADQAARILGIDTWDHHFARLESGQSTGWFFVMQTDDDARIDRVIALAEAVLPLDDLSAGPADEMGMGLAWANHHHLDFVVQDLRRFPGKGWPLVRAALRSPIIRSRNMALRALSTWGEDYWPDDARALLERALAEEPTDDVRDAIHKVLTGEPLG